MSLQIARYKDVYNVTLGIYIYINLFIIITVQQQIINKQ